MNAALMEVIERGSVKIPFSGCWIWEKSASRKAYGKLTFMGKQITAHRASYMASHPDEAAPKLVCHHCDVSLCVNPDHLYSGDYASNRADMLDRNRWSHPYSKNNSCFAGHSYTEGSYRIAKDGSRVCKECMNQHSRNWRKTQKEDKS